LKLVNTLLDFSRMEADRVQAKFQPVNLETATAEIASVFRSAIEKAGLEYEVHCRDLGTPVYVDPQMWEKIVLNLVFHFLTKWDCSPRCVGMSKGSRNAAVSTGVSKYGGQHDRGSHDSGKECARPICCWPSLVLKVPKNSCHLGRLGRVSPAAGVASGRSNCKGPLGLPCAVTPEGRDRQFQDQCWARLFQPSILWTL
jgi:hypothetical protein